MLKPDTALITSPLELLSLLKRIQKSKQLISVTFDSYQQPLLTSLLEVNFHTKTLIFDEPNPLPEQKILATKNEAEFSLKLEKLPIKFKAKFILNNATDSLNDLYTSFPKEIYYPQNRSFYRFRTESIENISATIFLSSKKRIPCQLINISLNGLCLRIPYSLASIFKIYKIINDIHIQLPEQSGFSISAEIKNMQIVNNYTNMDIGLQIQEQTDTVEKIIQQFIFRSESI